MDKNKAKTSVILVVIALVYTISPIDLLIGPIDDIIVDVAVFFVTTFMHKASEKSKDKLKGNTFIKPEYVDSISAAMIDKSTATIRNTVANKKVVNKEVDKNLDTKEEITDSKTMSVFK